MDRAEFHSCILRLLTHSIVFGKLSGPQRCGQWFSGLGRIFDAPFVHQMSASSMPSSDAADVSFLLVRNVRIINRARAHTHAHMHTHSWDQLK